MSLVATSTPQPLLDVNGNPIGGIEPTATFDGCLVVFNRMGPGVVSDGLYYTYNADAATSPTAGWSVPKRITEMNADSAVVARGYPLSIYPIRDPYGLGFADSGATLDGAYVWMSPDGSDLFFVALPGRHGASVVEFEHQGHAAHARQPSQSAARNARRELRCAAVLRQLARSYAGDVGPPRASAVEGPAAYRQARYTYPMFEANEAMYFEASFEETLVGNYDAYFDMSETINQSCRQRFCPPSRTTRGTSTSAR